MDVTQTQNELALAEKGLKPYQDPNLYTAIQNQVMNQWTPALTSATTAAGKEMAGALPSFMNIPYSQLAGGTTSADLNPQQKMQLMGTGLGNIVGQLSKATSLAEYLGGKASEMQNKALQAAQLGYTTASDAYSRSWQKYQQAASEAAQKAASAKGGIRGLPEPTQTTGTLQTELDALVEAGDEAGLYQKLNAIEGGMGGKKNLTPEQQKALGEYWDKYQAMKNMNWIKNLNFKMF
jgi:hypothetical protein